MSISSVKKDCEMNMKRDRDDDSEITVMRTREMTMKIEDEVNYT